MEQTGTLPADWKQGSCFNELGEPRDFEREYNSECFSDTFSQIMTITVTLGTWRQPEQNQTQTQDYSVLICRNRQKRKKH